MSAVTYAGLKLSI